MTKAEAFKKLVAAYGLKFKIGNDILGAWHYVIFPRSDCNNNCCSLSDNGYTATLTPNYHSNLFGNKHLCVRSLNEVIRSGVGGKLCAECTTKYINKLIDYKSLDELDIMLTLSGANHK